MFSAAVCPCRCATTQCSTRIALPLCGSGQRAMSPAAKIPGALVSRNSVTVTPRSIARPAFSARLSRGRTPTPATTRSAAMVPPLLSVTWRGAIALGASSRWKATPCSSCRPRTKSPISGPSTRSIGRLSGATTCTSSPRARSDAATSRPMKLAPMTTARRAVAAALMIEQQSVERNIVATVEDHPARAYVDCGDLCFQSQVDTMLGVKPFISQWHPFLGRRAGEVILGQVRPVYRRCIVVAQHRDVTVETLPAEHLDGGESRCSAADHHDPLCEPGANGDKLSFSCCDLLSHIHFAVAKLRRPASDGAQRRRS